MVHFWTGLDSVDFEVGVLRFGDGYTSTGGYAGNKGRRVRSVPMSAQVRAVLAPICESKERQMLVFEEAGRPGEPVSGANLYRRFLGAAKRAGLPAIRLHDLRHTFGTQAIRMLKVHEVQRLMGHRHITTTERYLHYAPDPALGATLSEVWAEAEQGADPARMIRLRCVA